MRKIKFSDISQKAELGDIVYLQRQNQEVVRCEESGVLMLNIDADELAPGDLKFIKQLNLTISNPETKEPIALGVELKKKKSFGQKLNEWFESDDTDDSGFFHTPTVPTFGGSNFGGFGGGFGGFGGGSFGGGGASRGF